MKTLRTSDVVLARPPRSVPGVRAAVVPMLACGLIGLGLALHHPLSPWLASALFGIGAAVFFARPEAWLIALPALLPVIGLAPWTGWITFEEFDLLVLAVAAGGCARLALPRPHSASGPVRPPPRAAGTGALAGLVAALFAASVLVSMVRGWADAGGFVFGWYQGYHEPMNSLRLAKPFLLALLLWPLWRSAASEAAPSRAMRLSAGLMLGLAGVGLAVVWERLAYTGLLNFSTDYRTTALFWEMHVGGAAIDGFLALSMPFAVREMLMARGRLRWAAAAFAVLLGGYACLSTFSRALYLAVPLGLGVLAWLQTAQRRRLAPSQVDHAGPGPLRRGMLLLACFGAGAAWLFPTSGYRGVLALLGATAVLLPLPGRLRQFRLVDWVLGLGLGIALSAAAVLCAWMLPKGAYLAYTLAAALALAVLGRLHLRRGSIHGGSIAIRALALAAFVAMLTGLVLVAWHWGYGPGLGRALPVGAVLLAGLLLASRSRSPPWPDGLRWQGSTLGAMVMVASVVGVFGGGSYMTDRFASDTRTFGGRLDNWRLGLAMLETPLDWAFGKGLGRFPANYALAMAGTDQRPGDYRLVADARGRHLSLSAGTHPIGWLQQLRFSQRVSSPATPASVRLEVRAEKAATLQFEVCEKHLLYSDTCLVKAVKVPPRPGEWQSLEVRLEGNRPTRGAWYAPRMIVFSVGLAEKGERADIDHLWLAGPDGTNLLANGGFGDGLAHWFFTSDGYHTPWHVEGIFMNALFDQGVVGVCLLTLMIGGALWRLAFGSARNHGLAPALAAALAGFSAVGLFSGVTDVPRVAFVYYFLLLLGLTLRGPRGSARREQRRE